MERQDGTMIVYYAHSVALYGTPRERRDIEDLQKMGFDVENPNQQHHRDSYLEDGMPYFLRVVSECDALAFRANPDGTINSGIHSEIVAASDLHIPVIELPCSVNRRSMTVTETLSYLEEQGHR
jgi:hypothetical protein